MRITLTLLVVSAMLTAKCQPENPRNLAYEWSTDTANRTIDLSEIQMVLPRGSFPTIDYPEFISKDQGLDAFHQHEPVIVVYINGEAKAYSLNMLTMHEMTNDSAGGVPILPTYCPLCNSSVVYDRRLVHHGVEYVLEFEVSGMLRHSDMIMADRNTESWWQQLDGTAVAGKFAGAELELVPSMVISVGEFFKRYPDGKILSPETGTSSEARYGTNPYEYYDDLSGKPYARYYDHNLLDDRLPAMERVIVIETEEGSRVYPFSSIAREGVVHDTIDGYPIVIFYEAKTVSVLDAAEISNSRAVGSATVFSPVVEDEQLRFDRVGDQLLDSKTSSTWDITGRCVEGPLEGTTLAPVVHANHFAFAWLNFHPEAVVYR